MRETFNLPDRSSTSRQTNKEGKTDAAKKVKKSESEEVEAGGNNAEDTTKKGDEKDKEVTEEGKVDASKKDEEGLVGEGSGLGMLPKMMKNL